MAIKNQRFWLTQDGVSVEVDAPAEAIYDLVSDMPRMGEWSPECRAVEWTGGASGPAVHAAFVGHNRTGPRDLIKWSRRGRVLVAERGREFAFATEEGGREGVIWRYRFEPSGDRTRVTESYEVKRIPVWARILDVPLNRHGEIMRHMGQTLQHLKAAAEAARVAPAVPGRLAGSPVVQP